VNFRSAVYITLNCYVLVAGTVSYAQTIINVGPQGSLQNAINSVPDGGIIELATGTYNAPSGGFTIYGGTKGFTVRAAAGASVTLSGHGATDILRFTESLHVVTFQALTFADGAIQQNFIGGAMTLVNVKAVFIGCVFRSNSAGASGGTGGGGLWINAADVFFQDCTWNNNTSPNFGGGLTALNSRVYLRNCSFTGNRVNLPNHGTNSAGAGIYGVNSIIQIKNCAFDDNQAGYAGGAIYLVGDWNNPTSSVLTVIDSEFTGNLASRDPSVTFSAPAVGGAIHTENQTTTTLIRCRFTNNIGRQGGAVSLFQSVAQITDCVFKGNRSTGVGDGEGFGGTIMALSTEFAQPGATVNHRPISLKVTDTLFDGSGGSGAREGACIYAAGDLNSAFGLDGVPQNGSIESNRGIVELVRVGIFNYAAIAGGGLPGTGGAILGGFINLTIDNSIIANCTSTNSGAGLQLNEDSVATISRSTIINCGSGDPGAAITMFGGTLNVSETSFIQNHTSSSVRGAALTTAPAEAGSLPAFDLLGSIQDCVFSGNNGATNIYDGDRSSAPFNRLQYSANRFFSDGPSLYIDDLGSFRNVQLLNSYVIARPDGSTTVKAPAPNVALSSAPVIGAILMMAPTVPQSGAPGETLPISSYLAYASNGGNVAVDGMPQTGISGIVPTSVNGIHTLTVGSSSLATVPPPGAAVNISTRLPVGTDQNVLIGGFIIQGPNPKRVIIRAVGPSLNGSLGGALQDPVLELHDGPATLLAYNDNWRTTQTGGVITSDQSLEILASTLAPSSEAESAIIATLNPGAYTAVVRGVNGTTGIALVEVYDLDADPASTLANISTRGFIQTGNDVMIGGFIYSGGVGATKVVVRGIGPSLAGTGILNPINDPMLELKDTNGTTVASNDDWRTSPNAAAIQAAGLQPANDAEAVIYQTGLLRGAYTAILRGKNNGIGVGLVEVYIFQ
jgi:hypothetical protein